MYAALCELFECGLVRYYTNESVCVGVRACVQVCAHVCVRGGGVFARARVLCSRVCMSICMPLCLVGSYIPCKQLGRLYTC